MVKKNKMDDFYNPKSYINSIKILDYLSADNQVEKINTLIEEINFYYLIVKKKFSPNLSEHLLSTCFLIKSEIGKSISYIQTNEYRYREIEALKINCKNLNKILFKYKIELLNFIPESEIDESLETQENSFGFSFDVLLEPNLPIIIPENKIYVNDFLNFINIDAKIEFNDSEILNTNIHPKHNPLFWNRNCYNLFKYFYDNYYLEGKQTKQKIVNVWFYLKNDNLEKYQFKASKKAYKKFIIDTYNIELKNTDKTGKYENEKITLKEMRVNFENFIEK